MYGQIQIIRFSINQVFFKLFQSKKTNRSYLGLSHSYVSESYYNISFPHHFQLFGWNLLAAFVITLWTGIISAILFGAMKVRGILRVSEEVEIKGEIFILILFSKSIFYNINITTLKINFPHNLLKV